MPPKKRPALPLSSRRSLLNNHKPHTVLTFSSYATFPPVTVKTPLTNIIQQRYKREVIGTAKGTRGVKSILKLMAPSSSSPAGQCEGSRETKMVVPAMIIAGQRPTKTLRLVVPRLEGGTTVLQVPGWSLGVCCVWGREVGGFVEWIEAEVGRGGWKVLEAG